MPLRRCAVKKQAAVVIDSGCKSKKILKQLVIIIKIHANQVAIRTEEAPD
jgi:hypothetical protein